LGSAQTYQSALWFAAVLAALDEPRVLVRGMRIDLVDQNPQSKLVRPIHQRVKIRQRSEYRINPAIVSNVITEVGHGRCEEGRDPDGVDAQRSDMAKLASNPRQIADPVAIAIREAAGIDLVYRSTAPPFGGSGVGIGSGNVGQAIHYRQQFIPWRHKRHSRKVQA